MTTETESQTAGDEETRWERVKSNTKTIGGAVLLAIFIRIVLFEAFEIDGPSMEPTLLHGDRVVVAKYLYGLFLPNMDEAVLNWGTPSPGDVVIVKSPMDDVDIVKRVIGVAGDTVEFREGIVYRNGEPLAPREISDCVAGDQKDNDVTCAIYEERIGDVSYLTSRSRLQEEIDRRPIDIPPGHIFVLGDHRDHSNDSRNPLIGPVPVERVKGKALFIYLSYGASLRLDRFLDPVGPGGPTAVLVVKLLFYGILALGVFFSVHAAIRARREGRL